MKCPGLTSVDLETFWDFINAQVVALAGLCLSPTSIGAGTSGEPMDSELAVLARHCQDLISVDLESYAEG